MQQINSTHIYWAPTKLLSARAEDSTVNKTDMVHGMAWHDTTPGGTIHTEYNAPDMEFTDWWKYIMNCNLIYKYIITVATIIITSDLGVRKHFFNGHKKY